MKLTDGIILTAMMFVTLALFPQDCFDKWSSGFDPVDWRLPLISGRAELDCHIPSVFFKVQWTCTSPFNKVNKSSLSAWIA